MTSLRGEFPNPLSKGGDFSESCWNLRGAKKAIDLAIYERSSEDGDFDQGSSSRYRPLLAGGSVWRHALCLRQIGLDPATGQLVPGGVAEQTKRVFENIKAVLAKAGLDTGACREDDGLSEDA